MGTSSKPAFQIQALKEPSNKRLYIKKKSQASCMPPPLLLLARVASTEPHGNQLGHFEANPKLSAASF